MATVFDKLITGPPEKDQERIKHTLELMTIYAACTSQQAFFKSAMQKCIDDMEPKSIVDDKRAEATKSFEAISQLANMGAQPKPAKKSSISDGLAEGLKASKV